jgi:hypothetical protein
MTGSTSRQTSDLGVLRSVLQREIDGSTSGFASSRKNTRHIANARTSSAKASQDQKRPGQFLANLPSIPNPSRAPDVPAGSERRAYVAPPGSTVREPVHRSSFVMLTACLNVDVRSLHQWSDTAEPQILRIEPHLSTEIAKLYNRILSPRSSLPPHDSAPPNDGVQGWKFRVADFGPNRNFSRGMPLAPYHEEWI